MKKIILINLLLLTIVSSTWAQHSLYFTNANVLFEKGKDHFAQQKYPASVRSFEAFLSTASSAPAGQIQEAEYYLAASAFELRQTDAVDVLSNYLQRHPYTPFHDQTNAMLGALMSEKKNYTQALKYFNEVNERHLGDKDKADFLFRKGYALLETKNYPLALQLFKQLKELKTRYDASATYYYAYTEYCSGNYAVALPEFLEIEKSPAYQNIVPYYIVQIYYAQKDYEQLNDRAEILLKNNPTNKNNAEVYRILGEIAYRKKDYAKAVSNLKNYEKLFPQVLRNDMYLLGLSYFQQKDYKNTVLYLSKVTTAKDEMTENAYLHLGNSYVRLNNINNARMAYEASIKTNFNKSVREEALFNYALTTYQTNAAFGESIKAFEQFLSEFPSSNYADKAYDYLASVYLTTKSYEAAYQSIIKIAAPNEQLVETKEYLLYQLGTEAFTLKDIQKATQYFTLSLQSSSTGKYSAECLYWRAECYSRSNRPQKCVDDLTAYFRNANTKTSVNRIIANYALGYGYFTQKRYSEALSWFLKYVESETSAGVSSYPDAMNRIGDCYFNGRNFDLAENYYSRAAQISPKTGDYALFQSAYVAGLQKKYNEKISKLEKLLSNYPKSEYTDNALYEMGRAYLLSEDSQGAISTYKRLLEKQPKSELARKAALEIGMIYFNENNFEQAIAGYKIVISNYPGSEESFTALESLEAVYIETNDVPAYLAYTKTLGRTIRTITASREDSLSFIAIEKQYMSGKYAQAIPGLQKFIEKFCPGGKYCGTTQYYLADCYYRTNDKENALVAYQNVLSNTGNRYTEEAALRCAEMTFDKKDYSKAIIYFKQLQTQAQNTSNRNVGRLGVLRCSYFLNDHQATLAIANEIIADAYSDEELKTEAHFNRAKAYIALAQSAQAVPDLKIIAAETRTASGAESNFLLANIYVEQGQLAEAEAQVMDFSKKNTPHQFWLARSFVLLADIYIKQANDFQAKQYLLSLQKNYLTADEIQPMITERLTAISERESKTIIN